METLRALRTLFGALALLAAAAACFAVAAFLASLLSWVNESGGWGALEYSDAELLVDRLTDAGIGASVLDPDDPLLAQRVVLVSEGMNERTARYVAERLIHLNGLDKRRPIELRLATSGGWLDAAFLIVDTMRSIDAPVNVTAVGGCYSAGTVVLAAATGERRATPGAMLSIHVNAYDPRGRYDVDTHELARFRDVYARYTDAPLAWFEPGQADEQYYLDAEQALEIRLIDEVEQPVWEAPEPAADAEARPAA